MNLSFVTDTSTLCVFDLEALRHRLHDDADWWSIPEDEVAEVNLGNVAFLGLGKDGRFDVRLVDEVHNGICVMLKCPSGRMFIGAGEEVTGGELEPEAVRGGGFYRVEPGTYVVHAALVVPNQIQLSLSRTVNSPVNRFLVPVSLMEKNHI
ncbi:hypothetical protein DES53_107200 [Roseimicrobium gellanilyticum]|uniref:Uncharacterized protein n=1 Tax=Roseimicrobium gellanilyticum TaxID=748857 RepID=A0A366HID7_9BACT|nr:DUF6386 family protein [Roseimicrobium gellanilyticum]RBP41369.1 hypothetical protein DES53_107200 [Roseimicrobium gellanilyticum]